MYTYQYHNEQTGEFGLSEPPAAPPRSPLSNVNIVGAAQRSKAYGRSSRRNGLARLFGRLQEIDCRGTPHGHGNDSSAYLRAREMGIVAFDPLLACNHVL